MKKINKLISKNYSFKLLQYFIFCLIFVSFININVDPEKIYPEQIKFLKNDFDLEKNIEKLTRSKGYLVYKEKQWNERNFFKILLRNYKNSECLIFGASSIVTISAQQNPKTLTKSCNTILNLGLPGGTFEDYFALSNHIPPSEIFEKKIFLSIQPFTLNFNRDHRWIFNSKSYYEFLKKLKFDNLKLNEPKQVKNEIISKSFNNLFSFEYFKHSLQILFYLNKENFKILDDIKKINTAEYNVMLFDGSRKKYMKPNKSNNNINLKNINSRIIKDQWYDEEVLSLFAKYKEYYGKNNEIIFLLTPFHPKVWELENEPIVEAMVKVESKIHEFSKENKIDIIGSYNPKNLGCLSNEFIDAVHPSNLCLSKLESSHFNYSD